MMTLHYRELPSQYPASNRRARCVGDRPNIGYRQDVRSMIPSKASHIRLQTAHVYRRIEHDAKYESSLPAYEMVN